MHDPVNHPQHYTSSAAKCSQCQHPIECIDVTRHMGFNVGNAVKYLWRHEHKNGVEDLKKAVWYINDQLDTLDNNPERDVLLTDSPPIEQNIPIGVFQRIIDNLKAGANGNCNAECENHHVRFCAWHCRELLSALLKNGYNYDRS